jgi:hypothetical protein
MPDDCNLRNNNQYIDCPPKFVTNAEHLEILNELIQREPIFHHPEFGTTQQDFENMTDKEFWEVGASGRRYSREYVLALAHSYFIITIDWQRYYLKKLSYNL